MGCVDSSIHRREEVEDSGYYDARPTYSYKRQRVSDSTSSFTSSRSSSSSDGRWNESDQRQPARAHWFGYYNKRAYGRVDRQDYKLAPHYFNGDKRYTDPAATLFRDPYGGRGNLSQSFTPRYELR